jgi:ribosomal protein L40E
LSLVGALLFLFYAIFYDKHHVIIFAYLFSWIPYIRNLIIHRRTKASQSDCTGCGKKNPPQANYCPHCGVKAV